MLGVGSWAGCVARLIWCDAPSDVVKVLVVAEAEFVSTSHIDLLVAPVRSVEVVDEYGALAVALISTQWRCQSFTSFPCRRWTTCTRHNMYMYMCMCMCMHGTMGRGLLAEIAPLRNRQAYLRNLVCQPRGRAPPPVAESTQKSS